MTMQRGDEWLRPGAARRRSGDVLSGRYRLERRLAEGGMGAVWIARHIGIDVRVALKLGSGTRVSMDAIRSEVRVLSRIHRSDVVRVLDTDTTDEGEPYFVMKLHRGADLHTCIRRDGAIPPPRALRLLRRLARAIDAIHAHGVVHCDIKPGNVLVGMRDDVTVIDFGLATHHDERASEGTWTVLGTPEYMAPEQVAGDRHGVGGASDRYAFAAVALEVLTGARPYAASSAGALLVSIMERAPRLPSELGWPSTALDGVFARAMSREPATRFSSAGRLVDALDAALDRASPVVVASPHAEASTIADSDARSRAA